MRLTLLLRNSAAGIFCFAAFACNNLSDTKFEFYYYPLKNVYYDVANACYIYSLNGGQAWDTLYKKMDKEPATLGKKQIIYSDVADPWASNEEHRQMYSGYLLDIPNVDSTTAQRNSVTERKYPVKQKAVASRANKSDNKSEKKPGFFKRLFGKKH